MKRNSLVEELEAKIETMKKKSEKRRTDFITLFREKKSFAQKFYDKYKLRFTISEMSKCTVAELEQVGKHKIALRRIARRDKSAAIMIQKMWRGYYTRKRFVVLLAEDRRVKGAAVNVISAVWRGWHTRKTLKKEAEDKKQWAVLTI